MQLPVVVIDPGHGGNANTGGSSSNNATGPNGLLEKNLTLDVGRRLAAALAGRARVIMTRANDTNHSLAARARVARDNGARLFLSIHFNGFRDPSVDGTEVWVARQASRASRDFARAVLARLVAATGVADRGVRERDLGVLLPARHLPETAACLAEVAFLTNPAQARRLEDSAYLQRIAEALAEGVVRQLPAPTPAAAHAIAASSLAAAIGGFGSRVADYTPAFAAGYDFGGGLAAGALAAPGTAADLEFLDLTHLKGGNGALRVYYLTRGGKGGRWGDSAIFRLKMTNRNDVKNFKDCVLKVRLQAHLGDERWKTILLEGQKEGEEYKRVDIPDIKDESSHTSAITIRRAALDKAFEAVSKDSPRAHLEVILRWRESEVGRDDHFEKKHGVTFYLVKPAEILEGRKRLLETITLSDEKYKEWWIHVGGKQFKQHDQTSIEVVRTIQVSDSESQTGEETKGRSRTDTTAEERGTETTIKVGGEFGKKDVFKVAGEFSQKWSNKVTKTVSDQLTESVRSSWTYIKGEARSTSVKSTIVPGTPETGQTAYLKRKDIYLIPTVEFYEVPVIRYDGPNELGQATARREEATILPRVILYAYTQVESDPSQQGQTQIPAGSRTPPRPNDDETSLRRNAPPARGHALAEEDDGYVEELSDYDHGESPAASALNAPSRDDIVREVDRQQGTSLGNYEGYVRARVAPGRLFGLQLDGGVQPEFLTKLQRGEQAAARLIHPDGRAVTSAEWGLGGITGNQPRPGRGGWHPWGLAVDVDYLRNPYVMHERGEGALDRLLGVVYHRIARAMLGRDSVIPREITQTPRGESRAARTSRLYDRLREESDAMARYFRCMLDPNELERMLRSTPGSGGGDASTFWRTIVGEGTQPTAQNLQRLMMRDYVVLTGRTGPAVNGQTYPEAAAVLRGVSGDPPFVVRDPARNAPAVRERDPARGFLMIRKEIVMGLTGAGLRWGAIHFGNESGDVMHFDDGDGTAASAITRARRALATPQDGGAARAHSYEPATVSPADEESEETLAEPLSRPPLTARDARVAPDNVSPDYRHLGQPINTTPFTFNAQTFERLCQFNSFNVNSGADGRTGRDEVLFALRGCVLAEGRTNTGTLVNSVSLVEAAFDHQQSRCVLGVWQRSTGRVAAFLGSTVPFWRSMENYRQGGDACNMLVTGRYIHTVGVHHPNHRLEIKGALLQNGPVVVVRTLDDLSYEVNDRFENGNVGDNIHPSRHTSPTDPFSSEGCSTIPGTYDRGSERHAGLWSEFRAAAGLTPNSAPAAENGRRFVFVLLTGREARLAASGANAATLTHLRFGSNGVDVRAIQQGLTRTGHYTGIDDGQMGPGTVMAYVNWQRAQNASAPTADGVVTPATGRLLHADIVNHASLP
jgi:N-acetylmuramoyl-L-alanine amidase